jgi:ABC-type amino acid transport substrate-binding protein
MLGKFLFTGFTAVALTCMGTAAVAQAPARESILQKVQEPRSSRPAILPPFVLVDPNKKLGGYFIELMDAIVDNMGGDQDRMRKQRGARWSSVPRAQVDIVVSGILGTIYDRCRSRSPGPYC